MTLARIKSLLFKAPHKRPAASTTSTLVMPWASIISAASTASASGAMRRGEGCMTWAAVAWQSWGNTLFGYAAWGWLLARHPASTITPMALLVPVFGMGASALLLAEPLPAWKLIAAGLVMTGLALNVLWPHWQARQHRS